MAFRSLSAFLLLALLVGCDTTECESQGCPPGDGTDPVVAGVDLQALFATPRVTEQEAVRASWTETAGPAVDLRDVTMFDLGGRETVRVVAGVQSGGTDTVFVGAVRQPSRAPGDTRMRPAFLFLGNGPDADVADLSATLPLLPDLDGTFVALFLAYRGGALTVDGRTFRSDVAPDPYDADADDVLAFLAGLRTLVSFEPVDVGCLVAAGHGRGGAVVLLAVERAKARGEPTPALALSLGAPTDFFLPSVRDATRRYLLGEAIGPLPGLSDVLDRTVGRVRDDEATIEEARLDLLSRSPAFFAAPPPFFIGAHGERDLVVPIEHGRALDGLMGTTDAVYFDLPEDGHETVLTARQPLSVAAGVIRRDVLADDAPCRR